MIHVIESDNVYYSKYNNVYYFVNDGSKQDTKILKVMPPLEPDSKSNLLALNDFAILKRKKSYVAVKDEDLSNKCLYFGEFHDDNCNDISVDFEQTTCKVISFYVDRFEEKYNAKFALLLTSKTFMVFNVVKTSDESYKVIYAYNAKDKKVVNKKLSFDSWEQVVKDSQLNDYSDAFNSVKVDFDFLKQLKESGFKFTRYFNK